MANHTQHVAVACWLAWQTSAFVSIGFDAPSARADELPRYKLRPGQELVYRNVDVGAPDEAGAGDETLIRHEYEWTFYVTRRNENGTWRLVFRQKRTSRVFDPEDRDKAIEEPTPHYEDGYFDLGPEGRVVENWTIHSFANPTIVFPPLPGDRDQLGASWSSRLALEGIQRTCRLAGADAAGANELRLAEDETRLEDAVYLAPRRREYVFDRQLGLVRRFTTSTKQGWLSVIYPPVCHELVSQRQLDDSELRALNEESDRYYQARRQTDSLLDRASYDLERTADLVKQANIPLAKLDGQLTLPAMKAMLARKLEDHQSDARRYLATAKHYGKLIGQPAADWETTDLEDKSHSLAGYRGKVVVLDFWFRSCAWCIRAMPQIEELVDEFKDENVAILGVNLDRREKNAKFVVDALGLNYPTLRNGELGEGIDSKYLISGGPTLVVIDSQGVVRGIDSGYSPVLRQDLSAKIRRLLAERKGAAAR